MNNTTRRMAAISGLVAIAALSALPAAAQDGPDLPAGLEQSDPNESSGPALPSGLGGEGDPAGPDLPSGLGEDTDKPDTIDAPGDEKPALHWLDFSGFLDARAGARMQADRYQDDDFTLGEVRLQTDLQTSWEGMTFKLVTDFIYDGVLDGRAVDLERGEGWVDLRQANVMFTPLDFMDVKVGRQILTWGTGDQLFINDQFPKDWQAFFIGRDVEYLKAPSDAIRINTFTEWVNADFVYTPQFDADRFVTGQRLSYWNGTLTRRAGQDAVIDADRPTSWFRDDEFAMRLHKTVDGIEWAGYGYWGYWKRPLGMNAAGRAYFPNLNVYGASVRGQWAGGIANLEAGYYDSTEDRGGDDPSVPNSEIRLLVGYERDWPELADDLTIGVQYYLEWMMDHDEYRHNLPAGSRQADRHRHVITLRVTKLLMNQNLELSLFSYFSPSDMDAYFRPAVSYKIDDHWTFDAGGNVFLGKYDHTFFGQLERNTNIYVGLRYSW